MRKNKMGTYNNSVKEIVIKLAETLNDIEGDFDYLTLCQVCDRLKDYPHIVEPLPKWRFKAWGDYINK